MHFDTAARNRPDLAVRHVKLHRIGDISGRDLIDVGVRYQIAARRPSVPAKSHQIAHAVTRPWLDLDRRAIGHRRRIEFAVGGGFEHLRGGKRYGGANQRERRTIGTPLVHPGGADPIEHCSLAGNDLAERCIRHVEHHDRAAQRRRLRVLDFQSLV